MSIIEEMAKKYAKGEDLVKGEESICISDAESFEAGAEWALKEVSEYIRNNTSYSDKAWDVIPFVEFLKGNEDSYISYLENKKAILSFEIASIKEQIFIETSKKNHEENNV